MAAIVTPDVTIRLNRVPELDRRLRDLVEHVEAAHYSVHEALDVIVDQMASRGTNGNYPVKTRSWARDLTAIACGVVVATTVLAGGAFWWTNQHCATIGHAVVCALH
ncbi:MAG: hypothetical protein J2P28_21995 [Actinobacteria bacterium]|nr:hypothetical protein [Actinomycetota bacterium]